MANKCSFCGSADTQDQVYGWQCNMCGRITDSYGEQVSREVQAAGIDLNDPIDDVHHPEGSPATKPRTPDGVADPGTIIEDMSDAEKKGVPAPPPQKVEAAAPGSFETVVVPVDDRPTDMQTEHTDPDSELERVEDTNERGADMQKEHGFLT